ncbi:hypothetical protein NP493_317g01012 [Ridgeia piscesae]|uniref:Uncharacterized protein n=1 Tax=Ridgeia piscesae TaxID=27915 RepID=A0AAD9NUX7_RIDPI|nr:hypothetical protein NP493_317g01012 [Ridgeia piscesae]
MTFGCHDRSLMKMTFLLGRLKVSRDSVGGHFEVGNGNAYRECFAAIVEPFQIATKCQDEVAVAMALSQVKGKMAELAKVELFTFSTKTTDSFMNEYQQYLTETVTFICNI